MIKLHAYGPVKERNNICRVGRVAPFDCVVYKTSGQLFRLVGMGKTKMGVMGDRLVLCRGDGTNAWDLEEDGIGSREKWLNSIVSHHSIRGLLDTHYSFKELDISRKRCRVEAVGRKVRFFRRS